MTNTEKTLVGVGLSILLAVLGWLGATSYGKLVEIDRSLYELKIEVAKVQVQMLTRDDVREMIRNEIARCGKEWAWNSPTGR